jgi:RHS repeat-associated protein
VATVDDSTTATAIAGYSEQTEYGVSRDTSTARYAGWAPSSASSDAVAGLVLMGVRLYNPVTAGSCRSTPVPEGNANAYEYCGSDPLNCTDLSGMVSYPKYKAFSLPRVLRLALPVGASIDVKALGYTMKKTAQAGAAPARRSGAS